MYPQPIYNLINSLKKLPGVGQRTAERFVFYLLKSGKGEVAELINSLNQLIGTIKSCELCWDFSEKNPCINCSDSKKDITTLCIVAEPQYIHTILSTTKYNGLFFTTRGTLNSETQNFEQLKLDCLFKRIKTEKIKEVILAFNPDLEGETTILFLTQKIKKINPDIKITRLARGLPMGGDMLYADEITLASAIENRTDSAK